MLTYFVSDFHLGITARLTSLEREKQICRWIDSIKHNAAAIYFVGDMFDYWFEYRETIPRDKNEQREIAVIAGEAFGLKSEVSDTSPLVMAEIRTFQTTNIPFEFPKEFEIGIYMMSGHVKVTDQDAKPLQMLILERCNTGILEVAANSHFVILGGKPFTTGRHIWWNLVSSSLEKIEAAKKQWRDGTFPMVPGETEFIPLPEK